MSDTTDRHRVVLPNAALACLLLTAMFAAGMWDVAAYVAGKPEITVSDLIGSWAERFPIFPLALGVLIGHLFWPR